MMQEWCNKRKIRLLTIQQTEHVYPDDIYIDLQQHTTG